MLFRSDPASSQIAAPTARQIQSSGEGHQVWLHQTRRHAFRTWCRTSRGSWCDRRRLLLLIVPTPAALQHNHRTIQHDRARLPLPNVLCRIRSCIRVRRSLLSTVDRIPRQRLQRSLLMSCWNGFQTCLVVPPCLLHRAIRCAACSLPSPHSIRPRKSPRRQSAGLV